jgi:hypothetical protein
MLFWPSSLSEETEIAQPGSRPDGHDLSPHQQA